VEELSTACADVRWDVVEERKVSWALRFQTHGSSDSAAMALEKSLVGDEMEDRENLAVRIVTGFSDDDC
jgi:hypothetical protein